MIGWQGRAPTRPDTAHSKAETRKRVVASMRRFYEDNRSRLFGRPQAPRLMTMLLMFAVVGMLFYRMRDPDTWRWLAPGEEAQSEAAEKLPGSATPPGTDSATAAPKLEPTGPTDEDPDEADEIREARQALEDGSLHTRPEEMVAYNQVLAWVKNQPLGLLRQRARKDVIYDQFIADPEAMRFKIVQLDLIVRQVIKCDIKTTAGADLYEIRGFTSEAGQMLYFGMVQDLPEGMPLGIQIREQAKLIGYFFKLQGYFSQVSKPNARPLRAPVVIGRLVWQPTAPTKDESTPAWVWVALTINRSGRCRPTRSGRREAPRGGGRPMPGPPAVRRPVRTDAAARNRPTGCRDRTPRAGQSPPWSSNRAPRKGGLPPAAHARMFSHCSSTAPFAKRVIMPQLFNEGKEPPSEPELPSHPGNVR